MQLASCKSSHDIIMCYFKRDKSHRADKWYMSEKEFFIQVVSKKKIKNLKTQEKHLKWWWGPLPGIDVNVSTVQHGSEEAGGLLG